jgi:hypothetical protein
LSAISVESWEGLAPAQHLQRLGLPVEIFSKTSKSNADEWPHLAHLLAERRIILPTHARLREELLNLVYDVGPRGIKVTDWGTIHQDHAVVVRGIAAMLALTPDVGPLDGWIMAANDSAPSATAGVAATFYGSNTGGGSVFDGAFGVGGGSFDLAKDAFGD